VQEVRGDDLTITAEHAELAESARQLAGSADPTITAERAAQLSRKHEERVVLIAVPRDLRLFVAS
jgi:uncharacterized protein YfaT (DUF1175 family)